MRGGGCLVLSEDRMMIVIIVVMIAMIMMTMMVKALR